MNVDKKYLLKSIALPILVGVLAGLLTRGAMEDFQALNQPPLSPPPWLFPVVWTILYTLMGVSFYIITTSQTTIKDSSQACFLYYTQLVVNFFWPIFFFNMQWYLFSFVWLIFLWILVFAMIKEFRNISKLAAYLNIPYLIWLTFAAYLNLGIWWLNR